MTTKNLLAIAVLWLTCLAYAEDTQNTGALSLNEISAQIEILQTQIDELKIQADEQQAVGRFSSDGDREELLQKLLDLQSELSVLSSQLGSTQPGYVVSVDGIASRGGQLYIPPAGPSFENGSLMQLQQDLSSNSSLEITGFMDAVYENDASLENGNDVYLNQVEVDLAKELNSRARASLGIIYADGFDIGTAVMEYTVLPESESSKFLRRWSMAAGRFDTPFGEDVASYASNSRKSVTVPAIVENSHNLWNDVGIATNFDLSPTNVDMWIVRGFPLQSNQDIDEPNDELNVSSGARLNFDLNSNLRLGGSSALGWLPDGSPAMQMFGVHLVHTLAAWTTTAEAITLHEDIPNVKTNRRGAYLQTVRELGHFFALGRVDYVEGSDFDLYRTLSFGAGAYLGSGLEFRTEFRSVQHGANQVFLQMVASF